MRLTPIINEQDLFLDINLQPLVNGKLEVLDPVSNNYLTIYTYSDDEYTVATNPIRLDVEGRAPHTYFSDRLSYVRVYAYNGLDEDRNEIFEFVRDYMVGEDEASESRDYVIGMEALRDLDPSINSTVNVIGYYNAYDCPLRTYYWDENCNQDVDNGYIVGSNVSDTGRWILLFDGEYLPSSYYGVYPGSEGNISALVGYPDKVGASLKPTAPGIWFVPGNYSSTFTTLKKLQIDAKCQFAGYVDCNSVEVVGTAEHYVGDFYVTGGEVHSSWYKNINVFLNCGASTLIIDPTNYFVTSLITNTTSLANKTLRGGNRLPATFSQAGCYRVEDSTLLEGTIFDPSLDRVLFNTDKYGDGNFRKVGSDSWDPGSITTGHRIQYSSGSVAPKVKNFDNPAVWAKIMVEMRDRLPQSLWPTMTLDFEGANVDEDVSTGKFTEVRNLNINHLNCEPGMVSLNLYNVVVRNYLSVTANTLSIRKSEVRFGTVPDVLRLDVEDSKVESNVIFSDPNMAVFGVNSYFGVSFKAVTENDNVGSVLNFNRCTFAANVLIYSKNLTMIDCVTNNATIKVFPYKDGSNVYHLVARLEGNDFVNNNPIEFTKVDNIAGSDNCYNCICDWVIVNNYFGGNTEGLRCRYWQNRIGGSDEVFIKEEFQVHSIVYSGNSGNCPWEDPKAYPQVLWTAAHTTHTTAGGTTYYIYNGTSLDRKRIMPFTIAYGGDWATVYITPTRGYVCKTSAGSQRDLRWIGTTYMAHASHLQYDDNGDFFLLCPSTTHELDTDDLEVLLFV